MPVPFKVPRFYPILDTAVLKAHGSAPADAADALLNAGLRILQYRHKDPWTQSDYDHAAHIAEMCHKAGALFVINDRADFAHLLHAALHVGQDDLPPIAARRVMSDEVIGLSTHSRRQLVNGDQEPVEYLSLGPIFATASKLKPDPVVGIEGLKKLRPLTKKPLVAIGGITVENAMDVIEAGADSVAVISGLMPVKTRVREWVQLFGRD
ncbi:MAG: thiamine phosphate synthase [Acidobacteriaceae bacterium]|nr:thiamine phosphate synthase [Acidobacteriaceae bacterium]